MPKPLFRPPKQLVKEWPEVFDELYMNTMPVAYVKSLRLEFKNGRIWEVDVKEQLEECSSDMVSEKILSTFHEYRDDISKVDFSIDIDKLKKDIKKSTRQFFK